MKTVIKTLVLAMTFSGTVAAAELKQQEQNHLIGFGSGVLVGSIVAGPIGGAIAGVFGLLVAEDVNNDNSLKQANSQLLTMGEKIKQREQQLLSMRKEFTQLQQQSRLQLVTIDKQIEQVIHNLESSVQFRSASWQLEPHYKPQLDLIAQGLSKDPQMQVSLSGYADRHGDAEFNQALSQQRLLTVKNYLLEKGVKESQILTQAFGESNLVSDGQSYEGDFFDRRVMLHLRQAKPVMTAAN